MTMLEQPQETGLEQCCSESQKQKHIPISIHIMDPFPGPALETRCGQHRELGTLREHSAAADDCPALKLSIVAIIGRAALRFHYMFVYWPTLR
jgi:hypothetical protein